MFLRPFRRGAANKFGDVATRCSRTDRGEQQHIMDKNKYVLFVPGVPSRKISTYPSCKACNEGLSAERRAPRYVLSLPTKSHDFSQRTRRNAKEHTWKACFREVNHQHTHNFDSLPYIPRIVVLILSRIRPKRVAPFRARLFGPAG